ncbi:MAG: ParB N-terminal domain-containing protein [Caldilineaceae bacterium]|nr:ParB N-terminal domain-containing protein [Caldilineaceae bacterium]
MKSSNQVVKDTGYPVLQVVFDVPITHVHFAPFQPANRLEEKKLSSLKAEIVRAKRIIQPVVLTDTMEVADGHRRITIAAELGWDSVPAIFEEGATDWLFSILNTGTMPFSAQQWGMAVATGDYRLELIQNKNQRSNAEDKPLVRGWR